jgi:phosphoribosylaminoimidazole-succinocarboxamide synthase
VLAEAYLRSGKVRDLYAVGTDRILLVASDRISAFDVVLPTPIPDKGRVLTGLSRFWFAETAAVVPNHLLSTSLDDVPAELAGELAGKRDALRGRVLLCRRVEVLPVEVVVRGYIAGSGWKDYRTSGSVGGVRLLDGLREGDRLAEPILTPATKAPVGEHDENITFDDMVALIGGELAERVRAVALRLYGLAARRTEAVGVILADTKFELGLEPGTGELLLADEVLTPDSSRFWAADSWAPGGPQPSYDKQYVRDWLETQPWDKTDPGPELPDAVVEGTRARYVEAFERITGGSFRRYLEEDVIAP